MLLNARQLLRYEGPNSETPLRRAKRLNNLGLCELLLRRYANGYEYFSQAFGIYKAESNLNILGLLRNIGALYSKWEMYEQAARFF